MMNSIGIAELAIIGGVACIGLLGVVAGIVAVLAANRRKNSGPPPDGG